jgi:hypothetical protein
MAVNPIEIRHLLHHEIDRRKWENCISSSSNPLIYVEYEFLNIMSPNWEALILGDYEYVMPLTWKKKWGIRYLIQPAFIQQTGIFSTFETDAQVVDAFLQKAKSIFSFISILSSVIFNFLNISINILTSSSALLKFVFFLNK